MVKFPKTKSTMLLLVFIMFTLYLTNRKTLHLLLLNIFNILYCFFKIDFIFNSHHVNY